MIDKNYEPEQLERKVLDLAEAMDRMKTSRADRSDVVIDMKEAAFARLELLAKDLLPVFNALPPENDQFEFALTNGEVPRLWIDMTSFVRLAGDRRTYEFVKDTRMGRQILARDTDRGEVGQAVTDYIAERQLERERMIEGDWLSVRQMYQDQMPEQVEGKASKKAPAKAEAASSTGAEKSAASRTKQPMRVERVEAPAKARSGWFWLALFVFGLLSGVAIAAIALTYFDLGAIGI